MNGKIVSTKSMSWFAMPADPQDPTQHIGLYSAFMEEIKLRTAAIDRYMARFKTDAGAVDGFTDAESCILQVRYICELIALSSAAVHNLIGITSRIRDSYQPGMIFKLLEGSNKNSFPRAVTYGAGPASYEFNKGEMDLAELKKVYNDCGELLHRGALKHALASNQREYAPEEIIGSRRCSTCMSCSCLTQGSSSSSRCRTRMARFKSRSRSQMDRPFSLRTTGRLRNRASPPAGERPLPCRSAVPGAPRVWPLCPTPSQSGLPVNR